MNRDTELRAVPPDLRDAIELLRHKLANDDDAWRALCSVMGALIPRTEAGALCEDEGCPHHGTAHECRGDA